MGPFFLKVEAEAKIVSAGSCFDFLEAAGLEAVGYIPASSVAWHTVRLRYVVVAEAGQQPRGSFFLKLRAGAGGCWEADWYTMNILFDLKLECTEQLANFTLLLYPPQNLGVTSPRVLVPLPGLI